MDRHAGFAAAFGLAKSTLDDLARVLYQAGRIEHRLGASAPGLNNNPAVVFDQLFLESPRVVLRQANGGRIGLALRGRGPVIVTKAGTATETVSATVEVVVLMTPRVVLVNGRLGILFDPSAAVLDQLSVVPFSGSQFSAANQTYLDSVPFKGLVEFGLRIELARRGPLFPPFDISFLGAIATDPGTSASIAVVDDAVVLGFDVNSGGVMTTGDTTQLTNFLDGHGLAMWTNPVALSIAFGDVTSGVSAMVAQQGGVLDSLTLTVEEGGFRLVGSASRDEGTLTFSLLASPALQKSGDPARDRLTFSLRDMQVGVQPVWWVVLLEIGLLFPVAIVEMLISFIRSNIINQVQVSGPTDVAALSQRFFLPGISEPAIMVRIQAFECHVEGVFVAMGLDVDFRRASVTGPEVVAAEEVPSIAANPVVYLARLGADAVGDDPHLRIRWTVTAVGQSTALQVDDRRAQDVNVFVLEPALVQFLSHPAYTVQCRIYRVLGARAEEVFSKTIALRVADRLDRSHPYVHWVHQALVPVVVVESDGSRTIRGEVVKTRRSKIHRTGIPGRCRMASHYSQSWMASTETNPGPSLEYLDALPFQRADLVANRSKVCDYCFFGGPTKTIPLIP